MLIVSCSCSHRTRYMGDVGILEKRVPKHIIIQIYIFFFYREEGPTENISLSFQENPQITYTAVSLKVSWMEKYFMCCVFYRRIQIKCQKKTRFQNFPMCVLNYTIIYPNSVRIFIIVYI